MILTLLPPTSAPTLHHPLVLPEPHHARAPLPVGWAAQLAGLQQDGLDMPPSIHALDGSSGWSAIVEECVFELLDKQGVRVECILVGGGSVVWDVSGDGRACAGMLREALSDLAAAKKEVEKERAAVLPRPSAPIHHTYPGAGKVEWAQSSDTLALPPPVASKATKHKKQRSLLFLSSIVSGLHKLAASASPSPTRSAFPTSPSPTTSEFAYSSSPTQASFGEGARSGARSTAWTTTLAFLPPARKTPLPYSVARPLSAILHAKARAGLVDAWRRYVLDELRMRLGFGRNVEDELDGALCAYDYPRWTAARMLRRTEEWMAWLVQEARENGGASPDMDPVSASRPTSAALSVTIPSHKPERTASELSGKTLVPAEEEGAGREVSESVSTEASSCTEDSESVHTPVDGEEGAPFQLPFRSSSASHSRVASLVDAHPQAADVPRSPTPPSSQATYAALSAQRVHLLKLLRSMNTHRATAAQDARSARAVLEVKSRRRAWSSRAYLGRAEGRLCGLATPVRSSPLARCEPTTAAWGVPAEGGLEVCTGECDLKELFPVEEVDEDEEMEEMENLQAISLAGIADLDLHVHPLPNRAPQNLSLSLPLPLPPTPSPSPAALPGRPLTARTVSVANPVSRPPLSASALLFQPLKPKFESQTKFALMDHGGDADDEDGPPYVKVSVEMEVGVNVREGWVEGVGVR
ncbi:uncharacterized protein C8Q71DRAFT_710593 [Rhodofomes roseus]|uniref:Uncharacterized protein n=1 Tax=Rhodofomes roseus TaxID=34475 RepID=A0ABQ8KAZ1_9APHY|nr:uncharacterized protein C8Q71DRAFT_710593 [Rhodofomes roseus]KAH9834727.1 hypothetical protein C8Q71DRAFT_710593 [Rhodofomes roseus]